MIRNTNLLGNHTWPTIDDVKVGYRLRQCCTIAHVDADNLVIFVRSRWGMYQGIFVKVSRSAGVIQDDDRTNKFHQPVAESLDECVRLCRQALMVKTNG